MKTWKKNSKNLSMSEQNHIDNLHSVYQWEDMREAILKNRYPNLWEKYKNKEPKNREPTL